MASDRVVSVSGTERGHDTRPGERSDATLIIDCPNEACRDRERADKDGRQCDGIREWTADFNVVASDESTSYYEPVGGDAVLRCPECGERGRVIRY